MILKCVITVHSMSTIQSALLCGDLMTPSCLQFMIPDKPAGIDHFDINSFAVCLLSKDVQDSAK